MELQPCGATHVSNTSEIGHIRLGKIENKGRNNRRVTISTDQVSLVCFFQKDEHIVGWQIDPRKCAFYSMQSLGGLHAPSCRQCSESNRKLRNVKCERYHFQKRNVYAILKIGIAQK
ncbi:hypothetical protein [Nguyenibacter vanlangensis]|uniref:hypothetical protein n=1 Tax=Nguyenibacter vanlangensis TaxID=1216886 RepID=UPI0035B56179